MSVINLLQDLGYSPPPESYYSLISLWNAWYQGRVRGFHDYRVFNGLRHVRCTKLTAGLAKTVSEAWADLLMNDRVVITLEGKAEQTFFDAVCSENNFRTMMNRYEEYCFALGTSAVVAAVDGMEVDGEGRAAAPASGIRLDFVRADGIFPLSWQNGRIRECAFATDRSESSRDYTYLQIHRLDPDSGTYLIENRLFEHQGGRLTEVPLSSVPAFASVAPVFHTGLTDPLFVINTPNIANNLAPDVPLGVSIFANAIDQLKDCDNIFDSFNSEFVLGRKRIMVKPEAVKNIDGEPLFDANDLVFYLLPEDTGNSSSVTEIKAELRTEEHFTGMQTALDMLSIKCGLGASHWKFDSGHITTATQILAANSEEYRTQQKHEIILEQILKDLARIILRLGNTFMGLKLNEEVPISVDFDESIIEDKKTEFDRDIRMLEHNILSREEFRAKWVNEDAVTAAQAISEINTKENVSTTD